MKRNQMVLMDDKIEVDLNDKLNDKLKEILSETNNENKTEVINSSIEYYHANLMEKLESESERDY